MEKRARQRGRGNGDAEKGARKRGLRKRGCGKGGAEKGLRKRGRGEGAADKGCGKEGRREGAEKGFPKALLGPKMGITRTQVESVKRSYLLVIPNIWV